MSENKNIVSATIIIIIVGLAILVNVKNAAAGEESTFIEGYASAILEREFSLSQVTVKANQGIITLSAEAIQEKDREKIVAALSRIKGVRQVSVLNAPAPEPHPQVDIAAEKISGGGLTFFPEERLYAPRLADPRWPHFSFAYNHFSQSGFPKLENVGNISVGEQLNFVGYESESVGKFDLGAQPAIFGLFNMDADSHDLINADYRIAFPLDYRYESFSAQARIFHQSSHLGDEFILDTPIDRVNLSYEATDLNLSLDWQAFRFYFGGGRIFNSEPYLKPWSTQQGVEFVSTEPFLNDSMRPVVAIDIQEKEETSWEPDLSMHAGVEFISPEKGQHRVQLLIEYYHGRNPNGQFYREKIETIGLGLHVYL